MNLVGKMLNRLHNERHFARENAIADLWKRNGLEENAVGYKIAELVAVKGRDGTEITEYRLYKLLDSSVVTISTKITTKIETGIDKLRDHK